MANGVLRAYVETPCGQLHYRYAGQGPPLLLLHQTASSSEQFEGLMPYLISKHLVLALDTPGCGMSDPPFHQYTIADYAGCVVAFLDALHIERTSIFGRHTGGTIALEVAAAHPRRMDKLIVYGVPYWEEESDAEFEARLKHFPRQEDGGHQTGVWNYINRLLREGLFPRPYSKEALRIIDREVLWMLMAGERYHEGFVAVHLYKMRERLRLIEASTLVMSGERDAQLPALEPVADHIRRVRTRVVPGGSYFTTYDNPEALSQEILDFIASPGI